MTEWLLLSLAGILGSAHCLGMCGPFALAIGSATPAWQANLQRQLCYSGGRLFTYAVLGASAAFGGQRLATALAGWTNIPAILAIIAGLFLLTQGMLAAGLIPQRGVGAGAGCPGAAGFRMLLRSRGLPDIFLAGLFTGLLPCGLLYGMLALAASTHNVPRGLGTMIAFGLGTVPAMVATGLGGSLVGLATRKHLHTIAAWSLILTGGISIARGAGFLSFGGQEPHGCPLCNRPSENPISPVTPAP